MRLSNKAEAALGIRVHKKDLGSDDYDVDTWKRFGQLGMMAFGFEFFGLESAPFLKAIGCCTSGNTENIS